MKKSLLLSMLMLIAFSGFSQKLVDNYVDEFDGGTVKRTSWEPFFSDKEHMWMGYFRVSRLNDDYYYFNVKIMFEPSTEFEVEEEAKLMFILSDKSVYTIYNLTYKYSTIGAGAIGLRGSAVHGAELSYINLEDPFFEQLREKPITKIRLYMANGYCEAAITEKNAQKIIKAFQLIDSE